MYNKTIIRFGFLCPLFIRGLAGLELCIIILLRLKIVPSSNFPIKKITRLSKHFTSRGSRLKLKATGITLRNG